MFFHKKLDLKYNLKHFFYFYNIIFLFPAIWIEILDKHSFISIKMIPKFWYGVHMMKVKL